MLTTKKNCCTPSKISTKTVPHIAFFLLNYPLKSLYLIEEEKIEALRKELLAKYSNVFGERLQHVATGGAHISDKVLRFLKEAFAKTAATNNYGTTEVS